MLLQSHFLAKHFNGESPDAYVHYNLKQIADRSVTRGAPLAVEFIYVHTTCELLDVSIRTYIHVQSRCARRMPMAVILIRQISRLLMCRKQAKRERER